MAQTSTNKMELGERLLFSSFNTKFFQVKVPQNANSQPTFVPIHPPSSKLTGVASISSTTRSKLHQVPESSETNSFFRKGTKESFTMLRWIVDRLSTMHPKALLFLALWYFFSGCTLFLNKYIVAFMGGDPLILSYSQMLMTLVCGFIQLYIPLGMYTPVERKSRPPDFFKYMMIVGTLRFTTVFVGLIALNYVEVSFTETVKSTAPAFTVVLARLIVGEVTGTLVKLSLIPVMGGLVLCSANELSFSFLGLLASLGTNISECAQNVYSKMLLSGKGHKYTPAELQYYTSLASFGIQITTAIFMLDWSAVIKMFTVDRPLLMCCILNGVFFHFQTISAYVLMDFISPVTHSVANTAKRALLIWLSVILFGNPVTFLSGLGTATVIFGVLVYNKAKELDARKIFKPTNSSIL